MRFEHSDDAEREEKRPHGTLLVIGIWRWLSSLPLPSPPLLQPPLSPAFPLAAAASTAAGCRLRRCSPSVSGSGLWWRSELQFESSRVLVARSSVVLPLLPSLVRSSCHPMDFSGLDFSLGKRFEEEVCTPPAIAVVVFISL